jgi:cell wall-associated NlpC family hydrolase
VGGGILFLWSGLTGRKWSSVLKALISGQDPRTVKPNQAIAGTPASLIAQANAGGVSATVGSPGSGFANDLLSFVGKAPYVWGGANPRGWDCSGACNWCICHDNHHAIPGFAGGTFTGNTHGPPTGIWLAWCAAGNATSLTAAQCQANDLVIWQTHMGIATSNTEFVSAVDVQQGTTVGPIHGGGPFGEIATFWRLH